VTSDRIARDSLRRARARRIAIEALMTAGSYPDVVRESQDLVELTLKGALRFVGVEPPRRHDVHRAIESFAERFPPEWRQAMMVLRDDLEWLAEQRSPAFYGDEVQDIPASALYGERDARRAGATTDRLLDLFARLLGETT
jgi:hypothetical protein